MTGMMVRMIRFQSLLMEIGTTGWMLALYCIALAGPMPKSQLFWMGTLMRAATGFWSFLARSASWDCWSSAVPPPEAEASADAEAGLASETELFWARAVDAASAQAR